MQCALEELQGCDSDSNGSVLEWTTDESGSKGSDSETSWHSNATTLVFGSAS